MKATQSPALAAGDCALHLSLNLYVMNNATVDPSICPLCSKPNACALVDGGKTCWCYSASISREAIERVPVEQQGMACICERCGCGTETATATASADQRRTNSGLTADRVSEQDGN